MLAHFSAVLFKPENNTITTERLVWRLQRQLTVCSSEDPEDSHLRTHRRENLKSYEDFFIFMWHVILKNINFIKPVNQEEA
jgi:hypothetical protein